MNKVIKNNDGVAIVEGTPASSLVKDVNKFFAAKPPERMAGESVFQPRKLDPRAINTRRPTPKDLEQMNNPPRNLDPRAINIRRPTPKDLEQMNNPPSVEPVPVSEPLKKESKFSEPEMKTNEEEKTPQEKEMKREEALDKTREFKRLRFAERSADEQEATKGKFITTLGS